MKLIDVVGSDIVMKKPDGTVTFTTAQRPFIATDFKSGQITRPARSVNYVMTPAGQETFTPVNIAEVVNLGSVNANAIAVVGAFKVTGTAASTGSGSINQVSNGVRNYGWFCAGGSYVHSCIPSWNFSGTRWATSVGGLISTYTFLAGGGQLSLREQTQGHPGSITGANGSINLSQEAITIDYKLYVGTYT